MSAFALLHDIVGLGRVVKCHRTILDQDVQALLDEEVDVEHDEPERERKHVVACPDLEELAHASL